MQEEQAEMSRQTKAALGLWEQMSKTASTPSTVVPLSTEVSELYNESKAAGSKDSVNTKPDTKRARKE